MQRVRLERSEIEISRVVLGCMAFGARERALGIRAIHAAFDAGVTGFDTAPLYGFGEAEELLGRAIADRRSRVQILTKAGLRWDDTHGEVMFDFIDGSGRRRSVRKDSRPGSIREEVERSLRRLRVECIDLLQLHQPDPRTPIADTMAVLATLKREGKLRAIGVSNFSRGQLVAAQRALGSLPLASIQDEYNLMQRRVEASVLAWAREAKVGLLAYSPLAKGVLAGRQLGSADLPPGWRGQSAYYRRVNLAKANAAIESVMLPIARLHGADPAQVALAWLLAQPGVAAVIAGASSPEQAVSNAGAATVALAPKEVSRLGAAFDGFDCSPRRPNFVARALRRARSLLRRARLRASR